MKVKDIVDEGFVSGFVRGLAPQVVTKTLDAIKDKPELNPLDVAQTAYKQYGHNPEYNDPKTGKPLFPNKLGYLSWLSPYDLQTEKRRILSGLSDADRAALPDELKVQLGIPITRPPAP